MGTARTIRRLARAGIEAGLGAGAAYLLDADQGADRRARLARSGADALRRSLAKRSPGAPAREARTVPARLVVTEKDRAS